MTYFPIKLPPGVRRYGTEYGSMGAYYDVFMVRWNEDGTLKPCGGARLRSEDEDDVVEGAARAILTWEAGGVATWAGIGTHNGLYVQDRAGTVFDITPTSFTSGSADASATGGYGTGPYGGGTYGTPRPDSAFVQPATQWTLDNWGSFLVGVSPDDGVIVEWDPSDTNTPAQPVANAPSAKAIVVTAEGFLFALEDKTVSWCDQRNNTLWAPDATNQAGDFEIQTQGSLQCGKNISGSTILLTTLDAHLATYIGGTFVFRFDKIGSACGGISRQCIAAIDAQAVWMGSSGFWLFNGVVQPLTCDLHDYVFSDLNLLQASKTYAVRDSVNSEVQFYYCSGASNEIDRCVVWNYKTGHWSMGRIPRTCGTDKGVFNYPIFVSADGEIFEHEVGLDYGEYVPYAEAGPIEIGNGDNVVNCLSLLSDEKTMGDVTVTFKTKFAPNGTETSYGPYSLNARGDGRTDIRFQSRQAKVRFDGDRLADWRVGTLRIDGTLGGRR